MKSINELFSFEGKVIVITGAAGAIGSAAGHLVCIFWEPT